MKESNEKFFDEVVKLIEDGFPAVEPARGKKLALMLGGTGAGKSTLINYLMGCRYRKMKLNNGSGKKIAVLRDPKQNEPVKAGHTQISETLYPQVIQKAELENFYAYCDLPGIPENRGDAIRICTVSSTQIAARLAKSIQSIVVVLDYPSFVSSKGLSFKDIAVRLVKILKEDFDLVGSSVTFVVTKAPSGATVDGIISQYIDETLEDDKHGLMNRAEAGKLNDEELALMSMLCAIRENQENVVIANIFDNGESAGQIEAKIKASTPIVTTELDFLSHDGTQENFNQVLFKVVHNYKNRHQQINQVIPEKIRIQEKRISDSDADVKKFENEISSKEAQKNKPFNKADLEKQVQDLRKNMRDNDDKLAQSRAKIKSHQASIDSTGEKLKEIDTNEPVNVKTETYAHAQEWRIKKKRKWYGKKKGRRILVQGMTEKKFDFDLKHPILSVIPSDVKEGYFDPQKEVINLEIGKASQTFVFERSSNASATVKVFAAKKYVGENPTLIEGYKKQISDQTNLMNEESKNCTALIQANTRLEADIKAREAEIVNGQVEQAKLVQRLDYEIKERKSLIVKATEQKREAQTLLKRYQDELSSLKVIQSAKKTLFDIVVKIILILELNVDIPDEVKKANNDQAPKPGPNKSENNNPVPPKADRNNEFPKKSGRGPGFFEETNPHEKGRRELELAFEEAKKFRESDKAQFVIRLSRLKLDAMTHGRKDSAWASNFQSKIQAEQENALRPGPK